MARSCRGDEVELCIVYLSDRMDIPRSAYCSLWSFVGLMKQGRVVFWTELTCFRTPLGEFFVPGSTAQP